MPVIRLFYEDLENLTGVSIEKIKERLPLMSADVEREEMDYMDVEFFPNRPDLFSVEGVSRALKQFLDIESGLVCYEMEKSGIEMVVDASVSEVRPYIVCGVVKNLHLDSKGIESLMLLQEHLHRGMGRNREKVSVGVHDLATVKPPFRYLAVEPSFSFVPLKLDYEAAKRLTMAEILVQHPKGVDFGYILEGKDKYPLILDSSGNVLSFPPIINAELTRVTESTKDIFIEVTGLNENVSIALNVIVTALAERGGEIGSVIVIKEQSGARKETPYLTPKTMEVPTKDVGSLIGVELSEEECKKCCLRMGFEAEAGTDIDIDIIRVKIPAYRYDVLHPRDIIEDIAIGYGYDRIPSVVPNTPGIGAVHPIEDKKRNIRELMTGLGYFEVQTFTLGSEKKQIEMMERSIGEREEEVVKVAFPISREHTMMRRSILPNLLEVLSLNTHRDLPQRIFEVGFVVLGFEEEHRLAAVSTHANANFAEVKSVMDAVLKELVPGLELKPIKMVESEDGAFLAGRRADIMVEGESFSKLVKIGVFGEIHPQVITNFRLSNPVAGFEVSLFPPSFVA
jgi:phenylalanyl-tRNA synthetase beta chain